MRADSLWLTRAGAAACFVLPAAAGSGLAALLPYFLGALVCRHPFADRYLAHVVLLGLLVLCRTRRPSLGRKRPARWGIKPGGGVDARCGHVVLSANFEAHCRPGKPPAYQNTRYQFPTGSKIATPSSIHRRAWPPGLIPSSFFTAARAFVRRPSISRLSAGCRTKVFALSLRSSGIRSIHVLAENQ